MPRIKPPKAGFPSKNPFDLKPEFQFEKKVGIGIDPGKKGAVCLYTHNGLMFFDWPKDDNIISIWKSAFLGAYDSSKEEIKVEIILEKVNAMPKQGVTSMFNFGRNFGQWIAMLQILQLPYHLLPPQQWRKGIVYPSDGNPKEAAFKAFQRLFPECIDQVKGAKGAIKDGRVDAALMAYKAYTM